MADLSPVFSSVVEDTGVVIVAAAQRLNFVGAVVTQSAPGEATITVGGGGGGWSTSGNALTGGTPTTPNEFFGSTNDFDVISRRNNIEILRIFSGGLLVGLTAGQTIAGNPSGGKLQVGSLLNENLLCLIGPDAGSGDRVQCFTSQQKVLTTDATPTLLVDYFVPTDSVILFRVKIVARQTGGAAGTPGDGAVYIFDVHAKAIGAVASVILVQNSFTSLDTLAPVVSITAAGTNIEVTVTGEVNKDISWTAQIEMLTALT